MAGVEYQDEKNWRYENVGTADSLTVSGTTLTGLSLTKSRTETAFYQTQRAKCFDLPSVAEIWLKFDVYFDGSNRWRAYNGGSNDITGITAQTSGELSFFGNGVDLGDFKGVCKKNQLQTILLHMLSGSIAGVIEAWVDGEKISTYTGDVNHGEKFEDIYLQSDGAGTFFSNVIISSTQIGLNENICASVSITPKMYIAGLPTGKTSAKPELYISGLPIGEIEVKPEIYGSIIQGAPTKITATLFRKVSVREKTSVATRREVRKNESQPAELSRKIVIEEEQAGDTTRKIFRAEKAIATTLRSVVRGEKKPLDTNREIKNIQRVIADTSRAIFSFASNYATTRAALQRNLSNRLKSEAATSRSLAVFERADADSLRSTSKKEKISAESVRQIQSRRAVTTDTARKVCKNVTSSADTKRKLLVQESASAELIRRVSIVDVTKCSLIRKLRDCACANTLRSITRFEKRKARTVIRIPHNLKYVVQLPTIKPLHSKIKRIKTENQLINTLEEYKVTAINLRLNEKTLSDEIQISLVGDRIKVSDTIEFQLFDYPFNFLVEETQESRGMSEIQGTYSFDKLLYTRIYLPVLKSAKEVVEYVAKALSLTPHLLFDDFTPKTLDVDQKITYVDLLSEVFGWTSQVPQRQVNVFIRGTELYAIQRGEEDGEVIELKAFPCSEPSFNKKILRTFLQASITNDEADDDDDNEQPFTGTLFFTSFEIFMTYTYSNGLLTKEEVTTQDEEENRHNSTTTYEYHDAGKVEVEEASAEKYSSKYVPEYYLIEKINRNYVQGKDFSIISDTSSKTTYSYDFSRDETYLFLEREEITEDNDEKQIRETYHVPVGNGFYAQTVFQDGELQGANISQGKPGNSVSQYTVKRTQVGLYSNVKSIKEEKPPAEESEGLIPIGEVSAFPIEDGEVLSACKEARLWLNRRIEETLTIEVIPRVREGIAEMNHIFTFNDKIFYGGVRYFLVSNIVSFTPRKINQRLTLRRWY